MRWTQQADLPGPQAQSCWFLGCGAAPEAASVKTVELLTHRAEVMKRLRHLASAARLEAIRVRGDPVRENLGIRASYGDAVTDVSLVTHSLLGGKTRRLFLFGDVRLFAWVINLDGQDVLLQ